RVLPARTDRRGTPSAHLLRASLFQLGTRLERKHQRASAAILPEEARLRRDHECRGATRRGPTKQSSPQDPWLSNSKRSIFQRTFRCTSNLNSRLSNDKWKMIIVARYP